MVRLAKKSAWNKQAAKRSVQAGKRAQEELRVLDAPEPRIPFRGALIAIILAAILPFLNTLGNDLVYDDVALVRHDPRVIERQPLTEAFRGDTWRETKPGSKVYRPIFTASLMLNHRISGEGVWSYHLVNILLHAAACVLLYLLLLRLFKPHFSLMAALLFALHPVHTEAVSWITGRAEVIAAVFVLFALLAGVRAVEARGGRALGWILASTASLVLGLLSKESAIMTPFLLLILLAWRRRGRPARGDWLAAAPLVLAAAGYVIARVILIGGLGAAPEGQVLANYGIVARVLLAFRLLWRYFFTLCAPVFLTVEYYFPPHPPEFGIFDWFAIGGIVVIAALLIVFRRRLSGGLLAAGWFGLALLPVLNLAPIGEVMAERFLYLPSAAFCAALAGFLIWAVQDHKIRWNILAVILILYAGATILRNRDWRSEKALWASAASVSWNSPLAQRRHGEFLLAANTQLDAQRAYECFVLARNAEPGNWENYERIALAAGQLGRKEEALNSLIRAEALHKDSHNLYYNLGNAWREAGRLEEALEAYRRAIELNAGDAEPRYNLGVVLSRLERTREAKLAYEELLELKPEHLSARHNLGNLYRREGDNDRAIAEFRRVLELDGNRARTWKMLSMALWDKGDRGGAIEAKKKAAALEPLPENAADLGHAYLLADSVPEARQCLEAALRKWPDDPEILYQLTLLEAKEGNIDKGFVYLKQALATGKKRAVDVFDDPGLEPLRADPRFGEMLLIRK